MSGFQFAPCLVLAIALAGCAGSAPPPACDASAQSSKELQELDQEQLARKLVDVTMGKSLGEQILFATTEQLRRLPGLPEGFIDRFRANMKPEDLVEAIVPIYVKMYERETLIAAINFYQSEQGRVLIGKQPEVTRLSMEAGAQWGRKVAEQTAREMGASAPAQ